MMIKTAYRLISQGLMKVSENTKAPIIFLTSSNDIKLNLATEEYMFDNCSSRPVLYLWQNDKTIVIGKHQNPWKECKVQEMQNNNINLARRKSGGGAVFHDLGNTCFSFINSFFTQNINYKTYNIDIILNSLLAFGIKAESSGRNDIHINGKKVSGSAYRLNANPKRQVALHHGTVMRSVNTNMLQSYLTVNKAKLLSKGVDSVKSHVCNISDLGINVSHDELCATFINAFKKKYSKEVCEEVRLTKDDVLSVPKIKEVYELTSSWEWLFGKTPEFNHQIEKKFDWALINFSFVVKEGLIEEMKVYSDCLYPDFIDNIHKIFDIRKNNKIVTQYSENGIKEFFKMVKDVYPTEEPYCAYIKDVEHWLLESI